MRAGLRLPVQLVSRYLGDASQRQRTDGCGVNGQFVVTAGGQVKVPTPRRVFNSC